MHKPPFVCEPHIWMHRLACGLPNQPLLRLALAQRAGQPSLPPQITRLIFCVHRPWCVLPSVCPALCMHRLACGPHKHTLLGVASLGAGASPPPSLDNKTPMVATNRPLCAPHTCMHRLAFGPPNHPLLRLTSTRCGGQLSHSQKITRLTFCVNRPWCAPPSVCTALCMHRLACGPPRRPLLQLSSLEAGASHRP